MSETENNNIILNDEIVETQPIIKKKKQYKPIDPLYNTLYYHRKVAPVECDICGCVVVNRALYNHKRSAKCKLVKHFKDLSQLEYDELKLTHNITT